MVAELDNSVTVAVLQKWPEDQRLSCQLGEPGARRHHVRCSEDHELRRHQSRLSAFVRQNARCHEDLPVDRYPPPVISIASFALQRGALALLPRLTNDRIHRLGLTLVGLQLPAFLLLALRAPAFPSRYFWMVRCLAALGAAALIVSIAAVAVLLFSGDAFPKLYARVVSIRERIHPITVDGLILLFVSETLCYTSWVMLIAIVNARAFAGLGDNATAVDAIYFAVVTGLTVGYGDITPVSAGARLLSVAHILVTATMIIGLAGVLASSYVTKLWTLREYLESASEDSAAQSATGRERPSATDGRDELHAVERVAGSSNAGLESTGQPLTSPDAPGPRGTSPAEGGEI
jgi:hypothetical protein